MSERALLEAVGAMRGSRGEVRAMVVIIIINLTIFVLGFNMGLRVADLVNGG